jgi:hypothetical protein
MSNCDHFGAVDNWSKNVRPSTFFIHRQNKMTRGVAGMNNPADFSLTAKED